jgi:hypothetical protein
VKETQTMNHDPIALALKTEAARLRARLAKVERALEDLAPAASAEDPDVVVPMRRKPGPKPGAKRKATGRRLSVEGRAAIAKAAKKRWAAFRRAQAGK